MADDRFDSIERRIGFLESESLRLQTRIEELQAEVRRLVARYLVTCPACKGAFDLLVNHYSIGLFDNLVYVKCPHCNKAMPVVDKGNGAIGVVAD